MRNIYRDTVTPIAFTCESTVTPISALAEEVAMKLRVQYTEAEAGTAQPGALEGWEKGRFAASAGSE